jgi:uncharacterized RDD family membrane protein YckC
MQQPGPGGDQGSQPPAGQPMGGPPPQWQAPPPQSPPPGAAAPGSAWTASLTSTAPVAGPAGYYYADVPNRAIAYIIDVIVQFVFLVILGFITIAIFGTDVGFGVRIPTTAGLLVTSILWLAATAAYFIYTWVAMRGTPGMKLLGMQIGNEADGSSITYNQALVRYAVLFGPAVAANLLGAFASGLGLILQLLAFVWFIVLLVTTAQSPTKQGIHDKQAHTMIVKAARSVA